MGLISKQPRAPSLPAYSAPKIITSPPPAPSEPEKSDEEIASENRRKSLLQRSRGRLGTIFTGFRGILSPIETDNTQRKNLLGE